MFTSILAHGGEEGRKYLKSGKGGKNAGQKGKYNTLSLENLYFHLLTQITCLLHRNTFEKPQVLHKNDQRLLTPCPLSMTYITLHVEFLSLREKK